MFRRILKRSTLLIVSLFLMAGVLPISIGTTVEADYEGLDSGRTPVAYITDGEHSYWYSEEDTSGHKDNKSYMITKAWADAVNLSNRYDK